MSGYRHKRGLQIDQSIGNLCHASLSVCWDGRIASQTFNWDSRQLLFCSYLSLHPRNGNGIPQHSGSGCLQPDVEVPDSWRHFLTRGLYARFYTGALNLGHLRSCFLDYLLAYLEFPISKLCPSLTWIQLYGFWRSRQFYLANCKVSKETRGRKYKGHLFLSSILFYPCSCVQSHAG